MKTVHIVLKITNSPWPEDIECEVARVFKGARVRAARAWAAEEEKASQGEYVFPVEKWEVE